ncbi:MULTISPECIES: hypothetical protein [unclassified Oleiphilus]|jgi:hypothetical protein|uniref:hypothetical protein n=3 Tax=Oleiphilus TaxID=141450 RepID=UPI0007C26FE4|nr:MULTISPECIES: hypothetical protein [unclassified Oleiphilus]KZY46011.1 hypothetical protein A3732_08435 [Oleiphilus sp. HI0050]KZY77924.1 hypothetical protein A3740_09420 [Oleiphilus sp. HI0068]KZY79878.1 hypothetical protein A3741_00895 [Oleiphilus sp. HI0069]KZY85531.1 hypothetical protein A3743_19065 [Oleiphilus sp. HI0072]KZZ12412.1 hypothetical protein A3749_06390 [Oleiphilus sp. HI0078]KZZ21589.1 hypothetical protein A3752_08610 [Oleiphilus sp. HI0081]KZZ34057.1 hypothetical protein
MNFLKLVSAFCLLLLATAHAKDAIATDTKLSEQLISSWMKSQDALEDWGKKHQAQLEAKTKDETEVEDPSKMTPESMISPLKAAGLYSSANQLVQSQGFSSIDEWAAITLRITKAAAAIEFEANPEMMDTSRLEALRNSSDISPEHKQVLSNAIEKNQAMVKQILSSASTADKEAIKPFLNDILKMMEEPY